MLSNLSKVTELRSNAVQGSSCLTPGSMVLTVACIAQLTAVINFSQPLSGSLGDLLVFRSPLSSFLISCHWIITT